MLESALSECRDGLFHARTDSETVGTVDAIVEMANRSIDAIPTDNRRNRYRTDTHIAVSAATWRVSTFLP